MIALGCETQESSYEIDKEIAYLVTSTGMSREDFIMLSPMDQRNLWRELSSSDKNILWQDKLDFQIQDARSQQESEFFIQFASMLTIETFETEISGENFDDNWKDFIQNGIREFGWSQPQVVFLFSSLDNVDVRENAVPKGNLFDDETTMGYACTCSWGWCPGAECVEVACDATAIGCGFLLMQSCNKRCSGSPDPWDPANLELPGGMNR